MLTNPLLNLFYKGIKQHQGDPSRPCLPITINIFKILRGFLWSIFTLAFYGFLRVSEFTPWSDIRLEDFTITLLLRQSETGLFRHSCNSPRGVNLYLQCLFQSSNPELRSRYFSKVLVNNLPSQVSGGVLLQYADDTTLICSAPDTQEVAVLMNSHLRVISKWTEDNRMAFNLSKSSVM